MLLSKERRSVINVEEISTHIYVYTQTAFPSFGNFNLMVLT
jgi:hypothetical protein